MRLIAKIMNIRFTQINTNHQVSHSQIGRARRTLVVDTYCHDSATSTASLNTLDGRGVWWWLFFGQSSGGLTDAARFQSSGRDRQHGENNKLQATIS
jgi:hypothetical protein